MDFIEMQKGAVRNAERYGEEFNIKIDEDFALLKLFEEVGEYAQAVLIHRKQSRPEKHLSEEKSKLELAKELADIVGMVMLNASLLGIDLEQVFIDKWINRDKKV